VLSVENKDLKVICKSNAATGIKMGVLCG